VRKVFVQGESYIFKKQCSIFNIKVTKIYILYRRPHAFKECCVLKGSIFLNTANCTPGNKHILLIIIACFSKDYLILLKQIASFESAVHILLEYTGMFFQEYNNFEMFTIGLKED
jgi:hypothetical protein